MADNLTPKEEFLLNPVEEHNITDAAIASFETNFKHPVKVTVPITPIQEGTGDPSPDNVRPISCWTGCTVNSSGKNLLDPNTFSTSKSGSYTSYWSVIRRPENAILVWTFEDNDTSVALPSNFSMLLRTRIGDDSSAYKYLIQNGQLKSDANGYESSRFPVVGWSQYNQTALDNIEKVFRRYKIMCRIKGTDSVFEPFVGSTIPISWKRAEGTYEFAPNQAGEGDPSPNNVRPISPALTLTRDDNSVLTVYGGSITFRDDGTSSLISTYGNTILTGVENWSWITDSPNAAPNGNVEITDMAYLGNSLLGKANYAKAASGDIETLRIRFGWANKRIYLFTPQDYLEGVTDLASFKAYLLEHPLQVVYPLLNSITFILSQAETQRVVAALGDKVTTTVYGGTVTLNEDGSADVVSNYAYKRLTGVQWGENPNTNNNYIRGCVYLGPNQSGNDTKKLYCDKLYFAGKKNGYTDQEYTLNGLAGNGRALLFITLSQTASEEGITNANEAISYISNWLSENEVYVCYNLVTPAASYHFPNVGQLKAFLGQNNVWSDIRNVNVKYLTQNSATGLEYRGDRALELRRRAMIGDAPTIHTTIGSEETGGLASFKSYVKAPVKKIEIPFGPKQDLHGYDHPWPAGGGKNLIPGFDNTTFWNTTGFIRSDGTITSGDFYRTSDYLGITPNSTYTYVSYNSGDNRQWRGVLAYDSEKSPIESSFKEIQGADLIFTTPENAAYLRLYSMIGEGFYAQLELGSTATAYEPYENICPIEGRDGCMVLNGDERFNFETGVLEFDATQLGSGTPSAINYRQIVPGVNIIRDDGTQLVVYGGNIKLNDDGTSVLTDVFTVYNRKNRAGWVSVTYNRWIIFREWDIDTRGNATHEMSDRFHAVPFNNSSASIGGIGRAGTSWLLCCPTEEIFNIEDDTERLNAFNAWLDENPTLLYLERNTKIIYNLSAEETIRTFDCLGVDASKLLRLQWNYQGDHSFTPIQEGIGDPSPENVRPIHPGLTITRDDDSVLSVYGGTLTVNADGTGSLVEKNANAVCSSFSKISSYSGTPYVEYIAPDAKSTSGNAWTDYKCSAFKPNARTAWETFRIGGRFYFFIDSTTTLEEMNTMASQIQVVYPLAEPVTYTLSVTETNRALEALGLTQHIGPLYYGKIIINEDGSADVIKNSYAIDTVTDATVFSSNGQIMSNPFRLGSGEPTISNYLYRYSNAASLPGSYYISGNRIVLAPPTREIMQLPTIEEQFNATKEWLKDHPVTILRHCSNEGATYHFSNLEQLKVWLGENNFWCDISDDITVKYWNRG